MHLQLSSLLMNFFALKVAATKAITTPPFPTPTAFLPPGLSYVRGYPLCGIPGFTQVPGNFTQKTHHKSGADLECCLAECRASNGTCKSIAFNEDYTECLWYNQIVQGTQLWEYEESGFAHYDLPCHV